MRPARGRVLVPIYLPQLIPVTILRLSVPKLMAGWIDIGVNLTDPMFRGEYNGKPAHGPDIDLVLQRAVDANVQRMIITGGNLEESRHALELAARQPYMFSTVGVHPTRCGEFEASGNPEEYFAQLQRLVSEHRGKVVAIGECGLDYDRLQFCDKETQKKYFELQFKLAEESRLPMFLHNRNSDGDFAQIVRRNRHRFVGGVSHSFTGSSEELAMLLELGLFIGINGCSLKTEENLKVMAQVPLDRLLLETDAPWCDIRPTHASSAYTQVVANSVKKEKWVAGKQVKSRNEPCNIVQVAEVVAAYRKDVASCTELMDIVHSNTLRLFWPEEIARSP
eukprot:TRINITY_DN9000_c0_g1_i1.p2 TRINITY_DN9000_c0_g1~~TRINITY_DN9000_c0_g1_i1.p2  ORF type:complete len:336 (-),score=60.77 TRINITY_DN9000_c0_g1_i1:1606-2613(-)